VRTVRVLIVDDQARFRRAAAAVVESLDGFAFVGAALDGKSRPGAVATVLLTGRAAPSGGMYCLTSCRVRLRAARLSLLPG
jgi:hypothetical protein